MGPAKRYAASASAAPARSISSSTLVPASIVVCSAWRIRSAVRIGRPFMAAPLAQEGREAPPLPRHRLGSGVTRFHALEQGKAGRPRARHANESCTCLLREPQKHVRDLRHERSRRRLKVVSSLAPVSKRPPVGAVPAFENLGRRKRHEWVHEKNRCSRQVRQRHESQLVARSFPSCWKAQETCRHVTAECRSNLLG